MTGTVKAGADLFHANRTPEGRRARSIAANADQKSIDADARDSGTGGTPSTQDKPGTLADGKALYERFTPADDAAAKGTVAAGAELFQKLNPKSKDPAE